MMGIRLRIFLVLLLSAELFGSAAAANAGTLSWELPSAYVNGNPIAAEDIGKIVVDVYWGPTREGPWTCILTSRPGATSTEVPDPPPWETRWYTTKSNLGAAGSGFSAPVRKVNYSITARQLVKKVAKKLYSMRSFWPLFLLIFLAGSMLAIYYLRRKGKAQAPEK